MVNKQYNVCKGAALRAEIKERSAGSMVAPEGYTYAVAIYSIRSFHITIEYDFNFSLHVCINVSAISTANLRSLNSVAFRIARVGVNAPL